MSCNYHIHVHVDPLLGCKIATTCTYLLKELYVFSEASVLLLEAAQDLISQLTHMLLQWIATVKPLPKTTYRTKRVQHLTTDKLPA